jgi:hypothetical protein
MPRRRSSQPGHSYSVFVSSVRDDVTTDMTMIYFGDSKFAAQLALAKALTDQPHIYAVEFRCDLRTVIRVKVERP